MMPTLCCSLCDAFLPFFQLSKLCPTCYKTRTIVKCYTAEKVLENLQEHFLISEELPPLVESKEEEEEVVKEEPKPEDDEPKLYIAEKPKEYKNVNTAATVIREAFENPKTRLQKKAVGKN